MLQWKLRSALARADAENAASAAGAR